MPTVAQMEKLTGTQNLGTYSTFQGIEYAKNIEELIIGFGSEEYMPDFTEIGKITNLESLIVGGVVNQEAQANLDLSGLSQAKNLKVFQLDYAAQSMDYSPLSNLSKIEHVSSNGGHALILPTQYVKKGTKMIRIVNPMKFSTQFKSKVIDYFGDSFNKDGEPISIDFTDNYIILSGLDESMTELRFSFSGSNYGYGDGLVYAHTNVSLPIIWY